MTTTSSSPEQDFTPVHQAVRRRASASPGSAAVVRDGEVLTYGTLDHRADRLAEVLLQRGIGPEDLVALCLPRGPELVTAALGVLRAGAAYLPLDPDHLSARTGSVLGGAGARAVITDPDLAPALRDAGTPVLTLGERPGSPRPTGGGPAVRTTPDTLAYVIYTSGSTGAPKGVMVEHGSLANLVAWDREESAVTARDRCTLVASPGFDASVWEMWAPLTVGASLHVPPRETLLVPEALREWLARERITITFLPTPLAEQVIARDWPEHPVHLRLLRTGGDRLHVRPRPGLPFRVLNAYGPAENTVVATAGPVEPADRSGALPSLGLPAAGTRVHLLDDELRPVPTGDTGQMYLSGPGLAREYLGRPDLTAERFVPDPAAAEPGGRMYRTGDLAARRTDGTVEFRGRTDDQVKIRGHRIEPGETTAALASLAGVAAAHTAALSGPDGTDLLVAYVVPHDRGDTAIAHRVSAELGRLLPPYLRPNRYVVLDALPLTSSGKIDRSALPDPHDAAPVRESVPGTPTQDLVRAVWRKVLGVEEIGLDDGFFDLGGHSLLLASVLHELGAASGGRPLSLVALFEHPTPRTLAAHLDGEPPADPSATPWPLPDTHERRRQGLARLSRTRSRGGTAGTGTNTGDRT
ncbi:non-ribosomal peptide synthetase [Streptomyces sp. NBC_00096]|uniref:non-ribosomal peptide synthetase n=1 Tax=Streptomyces sp. NBC_00096 TaxID=2975650 RepID=UPI003254D2E9